MTAKPQAVEHQGSLQRALDDGKVLLLNRDGPVVDVPSGQQTMFAKMRADARRAS